MARAPRKAVCSPKKTGPRTVARGTQVEEPVGVTYRGVEVLKCGTWSQGPVFLQQLKLLEGYDLAGLGHNTAEYLHTYLECAKLAFADRERYYGDPEFVDVPLRRLLSDDYAAERRQLIDARRASVEHRPGEVYAGVTSDRWPVVSPAIPPTSTRSIAGATSSRPRRAVAGSARRRLSKGSASRSARAARCSTWTRGTPTRCSQASGRARRSRRHWR